MNYWIPKDKLQECFELIQKINEIFKTWTTPKNRNSARSLSNTVLLCHVAYYLGAPHFMGGRLTSSHLAQCGAYIYDFPSFKTWNLLREFPQLFIIHEVLQGAVGGQWARNTKLSNILERIPNWVVSRLWWVKVTKLG